MFVTAVRKVSRLARMFHAPQNGCSGCLHSRGAPIWQWCLGTPPRDSRHFELKQMCCNVEGHSATHFQIKYREIMFNYSVSYLKFEYDLATATGNINPYLSCRLREYPVNMIYNHIFFYYISVITWLILAKKARRLYNKIFNNIWFGKCNRDY